MMNLTWAHVALKRTNKIKNRTYRHLPVTCFVFWNVLFQTLVESFIQNVSLVAQDKHVALESSYTVGHNILGGVYVLISLRRISQKSERNLLISYWNFQEPK